MSAGGPEAAAGPEAAGRQEHGPRRLMMAKAIILVAAVINMAPVVHLVPPDLQAHLVERKPERTALRVAMDHTPATAATLPWGLDQAELEDRAGRLAKL